jgi:predicted oxidoreductase (fatty acid repression mutant protein)
MTEFQPPLINTHDRSFLSNRYLYYQQEGFGASLQHYNPLIDERVAKTWNLPEKWKLIAQMPVGKPTHTPGEKSFLPLDDRVRVFNSERVSQAG